MKSERPAIAIDLPFDSADAAGTFGVVSGVLSIGLPYFVGLTMSLSALGIGIALLRDLPHRTLFGSDGPDRKRSLVAFGAALGGWVAFLAPLGAFAPARGLLLGLAGVPLWLLTRRALAFAGN